jgi:putative SOS response-associated peptidase YedK
MPTILTKEEEIETWLSVRLEESLRLQRPLPDEGLRVVARGEKEDSGSNRHPFESPHQFSR